MTWGDHFLCQNTFEDIFLDYYLENYKYNREYEAYNYFAPWLITFSRVNKHMYYNSVIFKAIINRLYDTKNTLDFIDQNGEYKYKEVQYNDEKNNPFSKLKIPTDKGLSWQQYIRKYYNHLYTYDRIFISIFDGNVDKFESIPEKDLSKKYLGSTGYNDRLKNEHMDTPIIKGLDYYGRPYIAVKYKCLDDKYSISRSTMVIFQRSMYSSLLVVGSMYYDILEFQGGIKPNGYLWLYKLINGDIVPNPKTIENFDRYNICFSQSNIEEYNWLIDN